MGNRLHRQKDDAVYKRLIKGLPLELLRTRKTPSVWVNILSYWLSLRDIIIAETPQMIEIGASNLVSIFFVVSGWFRRFESFDGERRLENPQFLKIEVKGRSCYGPFTKN